MPKNAQEFMEAVKSGDPVAQYKLGMMYVTGNNGLKQNYVQAFRWFSKSAEKGNSSAMFQLGKLYENGLGVEPDTNEALKWYKSAVDAGSEEAISYLPKHNTNVVGDDPKDAKTTRLINNLSRIA